jgi:hypothetical protein
VVASNWLSRPACRPLNLLLYRGCLTNKISHRPEMPLNSRQFRISAALNVAFDYLPHRKLHCRDTLSPPLTSGMSPRDGFAKRQTPQLHLPSLRYRQSQNKLQGGRHCSDRGHNLCFERIELISVRTNQTGRGT